MLGEHLREVIAMATLCSARVDYETAKVAVKDQEFNLGKKELALTPMERRLALREQVNGFDSINQISMRENLVTTTAIGLTRCVGSEDSRFLCEGFVEDAHLFSLGKGISSTSDITERD